MSSIFMRFPQGVSKAVTMSYDDGCDQDKKLVEIMVKHGLKGTFNVNSGLFSAEGTVFGKNEISRRMTAREIVSLYKNNHQEVAIHGLTHPFLEQLSTDMATYEVMQDRKNLEDLFGEIVKGMAYPFGTYNRDVVDILAMAGVVYSRTCIMTDKFDIPTDWLRMPTTCHHNSPKLMELVEKFISDVPGKEPYLFYIWGHSYEFERDDNWCVIEKFAAEIGGREDVWYATNMEIYNYVNSYKKLQYSLDGAIVSNPTATDLWCEKDGEIIKIAKGKGCNFGN